MRRFGPFVRFLFLLSAAALVAGCLHMDRSGAYSVAETSALGQEPSLAQRRAEITAGTALGGFGGYGSGDSGVETPEVPAADEQTVVELAALTETSQPPEQRILIYTAGLEIAVTDIDAALAAAQKAAEDVGGYLQAMTSQSITLRVPAQQFSAVLNKIQALGQTLSKKIEALDVTDEYVDLKLRLKNAEAMRERLLAILDKADTVKDMLEVERELGRIREEIERIKGRLTVLEKKVAFSTIEVTFVRAAAPKAKGRRPGTPFPWLDRLGVETVLGITR